MSNNIETKTELELDKNKHLADIKKFGFVGMDS
jgi:hypothetical protein